MPSRILLRICEKTWGLRLFHHPVAVAFTKSDYSNALSIQTLTRKVLRPTWDYLLNMPDSHKFFAITSTEPAPPGLKGPPLPLQPSKNFFDPIVWCVGQHAHRLRVLRIGAAVVLACLHQPVDDSIPTQWAAIERNRRRGRLR